MQTRKVKRYQNMDQVDLHKTWKDLLRWKKERKSKVKDLTVCIPQAEEKQLEFIQTNRTATTITWIGHSTFLIQIDGLNILTDPVWAERMGFERRLTRPGIELKDLPEVDVVLISHGHYDHLDFPTLRKLKGDPIHLVPEGLKTLFLKKGLFKVEEKAWWDSFEQDSVYFTFVPAQHWTRRTLWDTNTSHWGGWIISSPSTGETIYFAGDTGYFRGFQEIAARFRIDFALMPIGAYEPEWFMEKSHINPEDAIKAFIEMDAEIFIPMHYGTYRLADDTGAEALDRLYREWDRLGMPEERLKALKLGETLRAADRNQCEQQTKTPSHIKELSMT